MMLKPAQGPPDSIEDLVSRATALAGLTLGELAQIAQVKIPKHFKREKGWTGQLMELFLGARAGSTATQDFPDLGVELKTIPINQDGLPLETTYVCYAPLTDIAGITWETSNVRNKLNCVLWMPIEGDRAIDPVNRRVGTAFLWQPSAMQLEALRRDWEELMDLIVLGQIESITAKHGDVLQLRPKAADGSVLTDAHGAHGSLVKTRPRGFYLRKQFTAQILRQRYE